MRPTSTLLVALAASLAFPAAAATAAPYSPRPHTNFELRDAGTRIARFDVHAQPRGRRVLISVTMTARSRAKDVRAVLRVGRCTGGPLRTPRCEPQVSRPVVLHASRTTILHLNARVPPPSGSRGAIRVSLTPPGRVVRPASPFVAIVEMLVPSSAWTTFRGQRFGLRVARPWEGDGLSYDVRTITARGSQVDAERLRATLSWTARAIPVGTVVTTTAGRCGPAGAPCPPTGETLPNQIGRAGEGRRPLLHRADSKQVLTYGARTVDGSLFDLVMPWPR